MLLTSQKRGKKPTLSMPFEVVMSARNRGADMSFEIWKRKSSASERRLPECLS